MKIAIDIRSLQEGRRTGVEEYTINLLSRIFNSGDARPDRADSSNEYILFGSGRQSFYFDNIKHRHLKFPNRLLNVSFKSLQRPLIDKVVGGCDIFWQPNINLAPVSERCRKIITFHDLSFEHHPQFFSSKRRLWHKFINPSRQAREAKKIIAVSESTKRDLINIYRIDSDKIKVIYSGVGEQYKSKIKNQKSKIKNLTPSEVGAQKFYPEQDRAMKFIKIKYKLPERFILYLGTIEPRKNIIGIIKAFESLRNHHQLPTINYPLKLVIAGAPGWLYQNIYKAAAESKFAKDIIFTGFVEDKDKPYLYNLADIFVYPSFFEGFGFPPLEAMACGAPVIVSNNSSLPEVVGDAAVMVDPYNIDEIAVAVETLLTDEKLWNDLSAKGVERAKMFSWGRCAEETLGVLENLHK